jgi:lipoate-protein ligase A
MAPGADPVASWSSVTAPVLVVGRGVRPEAVNAAACTAAGLGVLHRRSGGGPVLWDAGLLALDVVLPPDHPLADRDVTRAYAWIGMAIARALRALDVPATAISLTDARVAQARSDAVSLLAARACFGGISPFEVIGPDGRKCVGLSQVRRRQGALFQCGIALEFDAGSLARALAPDPADSGRLADALRLRACGVREYQPRLTHAAVIASVEQALLAQVGVQLRGDELSAGEIARQAALAVGSVAGDAAWPTGTA